MPLEEQINQDLKKAMTDKNTSVVAALRFLLSAMHNEAIARKKKDKKLTDEEALSVIAAQAKKRKESIIAFCQGGRNEMAAQEEEELKIISQYLPTPLTETEIKKVVQGVFNSIGEEKNFGQIMKQAMAKLKGQADGQVVARIVKELLG